jgi:hypothetical protein
MRLTKYPTECKPWADRIGPGGRSRHDQIWSSGVGCNAGEQPHGSPTGRSSPQSTPETRLFGGNHGNPGALEALEYHAQIERSSDGMNECGAGRVSAGQATGNAIRAEVSAEPRYAISGLRGNFVQHSAGGRERPSRRSRVYPSRLHLTDLRRARSRRQGSPLPKSTSW